MPKRAPKAKDDSIEATHHRINIDIEGDAAQLVVMRNDRVLSEMVLDSIDLYDLALRLMRAYDKINGITA